MKSEIRNPQSEIVKPYDQTGSKKQQVAAMFDNIAPKYDFLNRFLSAGIDTIWRKTMIRELESIAPPKRVLDVATGTADVALQTIKQLKINDLKIIGLDLSAEMLNIGRQKVAQKGLSDRIELIQGDSEKLPFENNIFDAVTVAYGVRNFENLERGLTEIGRVLQPEGKIVVLEFSKPTGFLFGNLFQAYFKYVLPVIGRLTSNDPRAYNYLFESVQVFPAGNDFLKILEKSGFKSTRCKQLTFGICSVYTGFKR
jgi:demethylmenaquinone methyltransferase/2-methoxy-6-polyprenyl-1,4-benzoquinol methylase